MDIVFILREDFDRFAIENSVALAQKNLKPPKIFIIGGNAGIPGTNHFSCPDLNTVNVEANIARKIIFACFRKEISNPFLLMDDDMFILKPTDINFPIYYKYDLLLTKGDTLYDKRIINTGNACKKLGLNTLNYECHLPIPIFKMEFLKVMSLVDWDNEEVGVCARSIYGNFLDRGTKSPYRFGDAKSLLSGIDMNNYEDIKRELSKTNTVSPSREMSDSFRRYITDVCTT